MENLDSIKKCGIGLEKNHKIMNHLTLKSKRVPLNFFEIFLLHPETSHKKNKILHTALI